MGKRINTVMQPCFFALSGVMPAEQAIEAIKRSIEKTYAKRGPAVIERNFAAVDAALEALHRVDVPERADQRAAPACPGAGRGARLRPARDRTDAGRRGRPAACQRAAGRWNLPDRNVSVGEAHDRPGDPDLGSRHLHRLRSLRLLLPAQRDPDERVRAVGARGGARELRLEAVPLEGAAGYTAGDPGRTGRLHRMRRLRRHVPGEEQGGGSPPGDQPGADRGQSGARASELRLLRRDRRGSIRPGSTRPRSRPRRRGSRCSSSREHARAAARPPI